MCAQSHALGTRTKFQLEILTIRVISGIVYFCKITLESSRNICETTPRLYSSCLHTDRFHTLRQSLTSENVTLQTWKGVYNELMPVKVEKKNHKNTLGNLLMNTVKCHYNACHYNANASLTRSSLGSQTAPTCPHDHPRVAQHMGYRCEIIAVWSATAAMTPLCSHTNGIKQRYPTCWLCQYSRFMIDLRSNTLIIHLRCSENAINRPIWLPDARMLKTISVAIKLT